MKITRSMIRDWDACYTDERIAELVPREGLTPLQVLDLKIPASDRLWTVLREEVLPETTLRLWACDWAEEALRVMDVANAQLWACVETSRRYARGETTQEALEEANNSAWSISCVVFAGSTRYTCLSAAFKSAVWATDIAAGEAARGACLDSLHAVEYSEAVMNARIERVRQALIAQKETT